MQTLKSFKRTRVLPAIFLASGLMLYGMNGAMAQAPVDSAEPGEELVQQEPEQPDSTAADAASNADDAASTTAGTSGGFITDQDASQTLASSIIGMQLQNTDDGEAETIGKVSDFILDEDHKLAGVVVGVGGFLGMGTKEVGIPWEQINNIIPEERLATVDLTREELKEAPDFHSLAQQKREEEREQRRLEAEQQAPAGANPGLAAPAPAAPDQ